MELVFNTYVQTGTEDMTVILIICYTVYKQYSTGMLFCLAILAEAAILFCKKLK